jgi:RNA polymerase sigma factor for flagellar operon FliA
MTAGNDEFIREYDPFVRSVVRHTRAQLGIEGDPQDLVAYGYQGLLEARERFEPERGVQFKSFAYYRVRGAVLDGVRSMGRLPRRAYARLRAIEALDQVGEAAASARPSTPPPGPEGALRAMDGVLARVAAAYCATVALEEQPEARRSPEASMLEKERRALATRAIDALPDTERRLIRGHYLEGRRLDEIAEELGLSKSWGSRLHSRALDRLREALATA